MKSYYLKRKIKTIGKHINNVLKEELDNQVVVAKFATVQNEGTTMLVNSEFVIKAIPRIATGIYITLGIW